MSSNTPEPLTYISMFSGIEAASVAWEPIGFKPLAFSEVDPFASAVLKEQYPHVPNLGDITQIDWSEFHGKVDIVVGGSPCQSFSIAGLRKGLDDPRGNLMLEYLRACDQIKPEWIVWENVPGILSQDKGRSFGTFLGALADLGYHAAWRILDAQYFGVAQRRRRLFVVAHASDWRRAAAVLLERTSMFGDFASGREAREGFATAAQTGTRGTGGQSGRLRSGPEAAVGFSCGNSADSRSLGEHEELSPPIRAGGGGNSTPAVCEPDAGAAGPFSISANIIGREDTNGGNQIGYSCGDQPMYTLTTRDIHAVAEPVPDHGAGPADKGCLNPWDQQTARVFTKDSVFSTITGGGEGMRGYRGAVVLDRYVLNDQGGSRMNVSIDVTGTLRANSNGHEPIVMGSGHTNAEIGRNLGTCLTAHAAKDAPILFEGQEREEKAFAQNCRDELSRIGQDGTLPGAQTAAQFIKPSESRKGVRRLTPVECERLQGFPDNWTRIPWNGKPEDKCPNNRRYKAIGNSMAIPVMSWIGEGIADVNRYHG